MSCWNMNMWAIIILYAFKLIYGNFMFVCGPASTHVIGWSFKLKFVSRWYINSYGPCLDNRSICFLTELLS